VLMNETVQIALVGTLLAIIISFPLAFLAAKNLMLGTPQGKVVYSLTRLIFNVLRAFEPLLLAVLFVMMVGMGPFPGVLALGLHSVGMLGKLFSEAIEGIDQGPVEAIQACGGSRFQVIWYGILPQVAPSFLAFSIYRWDINIRMSIILGIVGAGGIGAVLLQYLKLYHYQKFGTAFLIILVVVTSLDYASAWLRTRLGQK
jgi:phosphonate transport system permease protein